MKMISQLKNHLSPSRKTLIGLVQLCSTADPQSNYDKYISQCAKQGADLVCLPENNFAFMGEQVAQSVSDEAGWLWKYRQLAKSHKVWRGSKKR